MSTPDPGPFPQDALEANRAGRLTDAQRTALRTRSRGYRKSELQFAVISTVLGLLIWFAPGPAKYATAKPLIGIACLILAGALVVRAFIGADAVTRDLRNGRVESAEGAIKKWVVQTQSGGSSLSTHFVQVGQVRVETGSISYAAAPEAGIVRIYYLPQSHRLVNLERLADRPLPADALTDPRRAMRDLGQSLKAGLLGNPAKAAEANAELAAIGNAMNAQFVTAAVPPAPETRDPRPLAQAILGTWSNGMISVAFTADGSVAAKMPGGVTRTGHWSVDPSGRLVSDVAGSQEPADAWVVGDHLTLVLEGRGITLQRASG
jgi:hypothetical protein